MLIKVPAPVLASTSSLAPRPVAVARFPGNPNIATGTGDNPPIIANGTVAINSTNGIATNIKTNPVLLYHFHIVLCAKKKR